MDVDVDVDVDLDVDVDVDVDVDGCMENLCTSRGNAFLVCFHLLHALQVCARNGPRIIKTKVVKIAEICFLIKL